MPVEVIGLDHVYVTVADFRRAEAFYDAVMRVLGFRKGDTSIGGDPHAHYFNRSLQYSIRPARRSTPHDPYAPGLHHFCFQVPDRAAVDRAAQELRALGIEVTEPALHPEYHPEYYAIFFSDPDGLRLEVVARTSARDEIVREWDQLRDFLNPIRKLHARREQAGKGRA